MHKRALQPAAQSRFLALMDRPVRAGGGVQFSYDASTQSVQVRRGGDAVSAKLDWIFGAGTLAFTPVLRGPDGSWIEHRVSWYSASAKPGMTLGHPAADPASAVAALGQPQTAETMYRCFNCHATGVRPGPDLSGMTPGVQCERCHGSGTEHAGAPLRSNIRALTRLSAAASVAVCAECHRMPGPGNAANELSDPMMTRFAPVGLMASKCFTESKSLTCVTCHDPHGGPRLELSSYDTRCSGCHTTRAATQCPRTTGCTSCHMRKATPVADLTFTDHRIRVHRTGAKK